MQESGKGMKDLICDECGDAFDVGFNDDVSETMCNWCKDLLTEEDEKLT